MTGLLQRGARDDKGFLPRVALVFALFAVLAVLTDISGIAALRFPDPDDTLRLVQVRDLIAGQGWFDLHQHRVDALDGGVPMHWSRLVDIPLAAAILALRPFIGQPTAEMAALVGVPLLTFFCAALLAMRIAWRFFGREAATFAGLALALSVPVVSQMRPLRIDHHGWQVVLALAAVNALMAKSPRLGGWLAGLALAAWLSISIEGLPLAAAIVGLVAWRWLRRAADKTWLVATTQGLAFGSAALFLATRGLSDLAVHCDAIAPIHLAVFAWGAGALSALAALAPRTRLFTLAGFGAVGAGALTLLLSVAPQCAGGGFAELDPLVRQYWYLGVGEGLPVWQHPLGEALQVVVPPAIGIGAAIRLARGASGKAREWWTDYALLLSAALLIAVAVTRAGAVAGALAAVPLGWQLAQWLGAARKLRTLPKRALALAAIALALLPAMPVTLFSLAVPARGANGPVSTKASTCRIPQAAATLRRLPKGEILAPLDIGPRLVYETPHTVIATGHHRGSAAMHVAIEAFLGSPDAAHALVLKRGTAYVALCPDLIEPATYAEAAPSGFAAQLIAGKAPPWLEPVAMPGTVGLRVWKVK
ncbi:MAG: hypothetical protein H6R45_999 [Proteobacteria bacterium]|nr:hypothetical protein [Pseudomonadota bacterium]